MAPSTTILADVGPVVSSRADDYDKLAGYAAFRRIKDDFEEPPRPSMDDVESVAGILRESAGYTLSQNGYEVRTYEPVEAPAPSSWSASVLAGKGGLQNSTDEGRTFRVSVSPGIIRRRTFDAARLEATEERAKQRKQRAIDDAVNGGCSVCPVMDLRSGAAVSGGEIMAWSSKSRTRMMQVIASLDYSRWDTADGTLAMVTLTLPADWQALAPDGATFKNLIRKFQKRWVRASGLPWRLLWKLEFQRRGAPHWHALMRVPVFVKGRIFTEWLSETWADVCDASKKIDRWEKGSNEGSSEYSRHVRAGTGVDFSGKDFSDPRRISMYFLGHSTKSQDGKEYQHIVPVEWQAAGKGPGRFWGYCGLDKAVAEVDVTAAQAAQLDRQLRKIKRARDWKMNVLREQGKAKREGRPVPEAHEVNVRTRGRRRRKGEKVVSNNGPTAHRTANKRAWIASQQDENLGRPHDALFIYKPRTVYKPFSGGQGGFVLVNDALQLGLDLARYLRADRWPALGLGVSVVRPGWRAGNRKRFTAVPVGTLPASDVGGHAALRCCAAAAG